MTKNKHKHPEEDLPQNPEETAAADTPEPETAVDPAAAAAEELQKWRDTALRTAAEYDNYRKRTVKDREEFARYANQGLLEELLPILDNFAMGMQMASDDTKSMIYIGMNMVQKQLADFLQNQGVELIPVEIGQPFDHNLQEAIQSEESDQPEGTILRIIRPGYTLKGRLLRPANVVVACAAAEPGAEA